MSTRPRVYRAEGIIVSRRNIGEADSIFTVFSRQYGRFDAVARGVRKARSRMRGHLEPLTRSNLLLAQGRTLDVFTQAETIDTYRAIREDLDRSAAALYALDLVSAFSGDHEPQPRLYALIVETLEALNEGQPTAVVRYFEMALLSLLGYELQVDACAACTNPLAEEAAPLSPSAGGVVCVNCRHLAGQARLVSVRAIKVMRYARVSGMEAFARVRMDDELRSELEAALLGVVRYHLDRNPRSEKFVRDVAALGPGRSREAPAP